jgi:cytochrome P450
MQVTTTVTKAADAILRRILVESRGDPYSLYHQLRSLAPLYRSELDGLWYASRYADCHRILLNPRCGRKPDRPVRGYGVSEEEFERSRERMRTSMLTEDPPEHTRLRRLVSPFFTPGRIKALRLRVEEVVDERLQLLAAKGEADAIAVLAIPLPLTLMGELLGVPPDDYELCRELVEATIAADRPDDPKELIDRARRAGEALQAYFVDLIARRQKAPGDDLLSTLVATGEREDRLTRDELLSMAVLLFVAGFTTTANLIGNGLLALLKHPEQFACIQDNPALVPPAVEEMLRYDAPVQTNGRTILETLELSGQVLGAREMVVTLVGAANRDPERFANPDCFNIGRMDNQHLSFGCGIHHCLGAGLARLEAQVVFTKLVKRFAIVELIDKDPPRRASLNQHGLHALLVHVVPH